MRLCSLFWFFVFLIVGGTSPAHAQSWDSDGSGNLYYEGGNVGVGTSSPGYTLDIRGSVNRAFSVGPGGDSGRIWTEYTNYGPTLIFYDYDDRSIIRFRESPDTDDEDNPEHEATIVGKRGNIGIGHLSPPEALSVAGNVLTEEVIVKPQSEWADYVLEPGYDLPPLDEVSHFINEEGRLPDVPSAEAVEEDGLRLGQMDATLLQKVEELTLYAIERQKEVQSLKKEKEDLHLQLQKQRKRNEEQQKQIDALEHQNQKMEKQLQRLQRHLDRQNEE